MTAAQRIRRAALPTALAAVIGFGGFAVGADRDVRLTLGELPGG